MVSRVAEREAVKQWFEANGLSISDWAAAHGFKREQVYSVLSGRTAGRRGIAHQIAVQLGLKSKPISLDRPGSVSTSQGAGGENDP